MPPVPETRVLTRDFDVVGLHTLDVYRRRGGYTALDALFSMDPSRVRSEVAASGLRGRGGSGFAVGQKWSLMSLDGPMRYLCANADESEPGTFKDRYLLERSPHLLIEGIICACYALGVHTAYVYLRGEFARPLALLSDAIREANAAGLLGSNIARSGFALDVHTHSGAGAYICGEETALIESVEGKRGEPRAKPPFYPAVRGLFDAPTMVHNVETLCNLPHILRHGAEWYAGMGTRYEDAPRGVDPVNTGTKLYSVSGHITRPGAYELEMGVTAAQLIEVAVPDGRGVKAVIPGGSSAPVLCHYELDVPMDFTSLHMASSMLGSGGVIVLDETTCMVKALTNLLSFYAHESCGQCAPCRTRAPWLRDVARRIEEGRGKPDDLARIEEIARGLADVDAFTWNVICYFGISVSWPAVSFTRKFRPEFEAHLMHGGCCVLPIEEATARPVDNYAWPRSSLTSVVKAGAG